MTPEDTLIVDGIVLRHKLTTLRQRDRDSLSSFSPVWQAKADAFENAAKMLGSSMGAYVAHDIHDKDGSDRQFFDYCRLESRRIAAFLSEAIPEGEDHAPLRQAVLDATEKYGVVTSVRSLNRTLSDIEQAKVEVGETLNSALERSAEAAGHAGAVPYFTPETAQKIATHFAHLQEAVHNRATSSATIFNDRDVGAVTSRPWESDHRAMEIVDISNALATLDTMWAAAAAHRAERTPTPQIAAKRPAKRGRNDPDSLPWENQRLRLRSEEATAKVPRTPALRSLDRPRFRGSERIGERKRDKGR